MIKWAEANVLVYSDSFLCLGKMLDHSEANERWKGQVADFQLSDSYAELLGMDGEPIEFEWNIVLGLTSLQILWKIQADLQRRNIEPEEFGDRIIFYGNRNDKPEGLWDSVASQMVQRSRERGRPVFGGASALSRGTLKRLKGKETIHFNADASNTELLFRIMHSANQLSVYGAVSQWCEQFDLNQSERESTSEDIPEKGEPVDKEALYTVDKEILKSMNSQEVNSLVRTDCGKIWRTPNCDPESIRLQRSLSSLHCWTL